MDLLSTDNDIEAISTGDRTVEIVGFISSINARTTVGKNKTYEVFKFMLTNKSKKNIQCAAWDADINEIEKKIKVGQVVHINGAWAVMANQTFNRGNVQFELTLKKGTTIDVIEQNPAIIITNTDPTAVTLADIADQLDNLVEIEAYLKTPFQLIIQKSIASYGCAAICNDGYKLEIRVSQYVENNDIQVRNLLKLTGISRMETDRYGFERPYLEILSSENVEKIPGDNRDFRELIRCVRTPKRSAQRNDDTI